MEKKFKELKSSYGKTSSEDIRKFLERIHPLIKNEKGELCYLPKEFLEKIKSDPRSVSFTWQNVPGEVYTQELILYKKIKVLIDSEFHLFVRPDVGEVFDSMTNEELQTTKAFWFDLDSNNDPFGIYDCILYK